MSGSSATAKSYSVNPPRGVALLGIAACLYLVIAAAGEVLTTEVTHADGRYTVRFDVRLAAPPERLKHRLTDYANYKTYFESFPESEILGLTPNGALRVHLKLHSCVLFFCRTVAITKEIIEHADGTIIAHIDPTASDFREATEQWRVLADDGHTRLQYRAELIPNFYVPPLIGPWILKYKIRETLEESSFKLEALARD
jgi:hypothetical protein